MVLPGIYTDIGNKNIDFSLKNPTIMSQLGLSIPGQQLHHHQYVRLCL
jgi:hypothetical protein